MADPADDHRAEQLDVIVAEYFEVKATTIVQRAVRLLRPDELHDDDAVDALGDALLDALERRYGRPDEGWRDATEQLVRVEIDRQVQARRRADETLQAELDR